MRKLDTNINASIDIFYAAFYNNENYYLGKENLLYGNKNQELLPFDGVAD